MDLFEILAVYALFIGAMSSPGPDFLIVVRNALGYSVRAGVFTSMGIVFALSVHITYSFAGIGILISQSFIAFQIIKFAGVLYLIYLGVQSFRSKGYNQAGLCKQEITQDLNMLNKSDGQAFVNGFVTNLLNPKATLFFVALFSQGLKPDTPLFVMVSFGIICMLTAAIWFSGLAVFMAGSTLREFYIRTSGLIDRIFGVMFIIVAAKLAISRVS